MNIYDHLIEQCNQYTKLDKDVVFDELKLLIENIKENILSVNFNNQIIELPTINQIIRLEELYHELCILYHKMNNDLQYSINNISELINNKIKINQNKIHALIKYSILFFDEDLIKNTIDEINLQISNNTIHLSQEFNDSYIELLFSYAALINFHTTSINKEDDILKNIILFVSNGHKNSYLNQYSKYNSLLSSTRNIFNAMCINDIEGQDKIRLKEYCDISQHSLKIISDREINFSIESLEKYYLKDDYQLVSNYDCAISTILTDDKKIIYSDYIHSIIYLDRYSNNKVRVKSRLIVEGYQKYTNIIIKDNHSLIRNKLLFEFIKYIVSVPNWHNYSTIDGVKYILSLLDNEYLKSSFYSLILGDDLNIDSNAHKHTNHLNKNNKGLILLFNDLILDKSVYSFQRALKLLNIISTTSHFNSLKEAVNSLIEINSIKDKDKIDILNNLLDRHNPSIQLLGTSIKEYSRSLLRDKRGIDIDYFINVNKYLKIDITLLENKEVKIFKQTLGNIITNLITNVNNNYLDQLVNLMNLLKGNHIRLSKRIDNLFINNIHLLLNDYLLLKIYISKSSHKIDRILDHIHLYIQKDKSISIDLVEFLFDEYKYVPFTNLLIVYYMENERYMSIVNLLNSLQSLNKLNRSLVESIIRNLSDITISNINLYKCLLTIYINDVNNTLDNNLINHILDQLLYATDINTLELFYTLKSSILESNNKVELRDISNRIYIYENFQNILVNDNPLSNHEYKYCLEVYRKKEGIIKDYDRILTSLLLDAYTFKNSEDFLSRDTQILNIPTKLLERYSSIISTIYSILDLFNIRDSYLIVNNQDIKINIYNKDIAFKNSFILEQLFKQLEFTEDKVIYLETILNNISIKSINKYFSIDIRFLWLSKCIDLLLQPYNNNLLRKNIFNIFVFLFPLDSNQISENILSLKTLMYLVKSTAKNNLYLKDDITYFKLIIHHLAQCNYSFIIDHMLRKSKSKYINQLDPEYLLFYANIFDYLLSKKIDYTKKVYLIYGEKVALDYRNSSNKFEINDEIRIFIDIYLNLIDKSIINISRKYGSQKLNNSYLRLQSNELLQYKKTLMLFDIFSTNDNEVRLYHSRYLKYLDEYTVFSHPRLVRLQNIIRIVLLILIPFINTYIQRNYLNMDSIGMYLKTTLLAGFISGLICIPVYYLQCRTFDKFCKDYDLKYINNFRKNLVKQFSSIIDDTMSKITNNEYNDEILLNNNVDLRTTMRNHTVRSISGNNVATSSTNNNENFIHDDDISFNHNLVNRENNSKRKNKNRNNNKGRGI